MSPLSKIWVGGGRGADGSVFVYFYLCFSVNRFNFNKKVLLHERKRHTARCVAIAISCYCGGGGPSTKIFFPSLNMYQAKSCCQKFFPFTKTGYPPPPPKSETRYPPRKSETRYPPTPENLRPGTPPKKSETRYSPPEMLTDRHLWKQYLPVILRMRGGNYCLISLPACPQFLIKRDHSPESKNCEDRNIFG